MNMSCFLSRRQAGMEFGRAMTKHEASHLKKGLTLARREDLWSQGDISSWFLVEGKLMRG